MTDSPSNAIEIQKVGEDDVDRLAPLFDAYRVFYERSSDLDAARAFLRERLHRGEAVVFLATARESGGEEPAGFTLLYPLFSSVSAKPLWLLNDLFVSPVFRKRGIGWKLLERARQLAEETGARGLELTTARTNVTAQRLYEAFGFTRDDVFYKYLFDL